MSDIKFVWGIPIFQIKCRHMALRTSWWAASAAAGSAGACRGAACVAALSENSPGGSAVAARAASLCADGMVALSKTAALGLAVAATVDSLGEYGGGANCSKTSVGGSGVHWPVVKPGTQEIHAMFTSGATNFIQAQSQISWLPFRTNCTRPTCMEPKSPNCAGLVSEPTKYLLCAYARNW